MDNPMFWTLILCAAFFIVLWINNCVKEYSYCRHLDRAERVALDTLKRAKYVATLRTLLRSCKGFLDTIDKVQVTAYMTKPEYDTFLDLVSELEEFFNKPKENYELY